MRRLLQFSAIAFIVWLTVGEGLAQGQRPQFRPAVLGSAPDSLINRIDVDGLLKAGQGDGAVMFCAVVSKTGELKQSRTYLAIPGSDALDQEVRKRLQGARFTPAIYNHQPVAVIATGTVVFSASSKPHVQLLLNQDPKELKEANDFIAPQPVFGADSAFTGLDYPSEVTVQVNAVVNLALSVDANGKPREMRVLGEEPPLLGFAAVVAKDFEGVKFIPAFRSGDPAECDIVYPVCYQPEDWVTPSVAAPLRDPVSAPLTP